VITARRDGDKIIAPATFTTGDGDGGKTLGEGQVELMPGDPGYGDWDAWLKLQEAAG
jgi:hypothetical protein